MHPTKGHIFLKMDSPKLVNYFEDNTFEDIDLVSYYKTKEEHKKRKEIE